VSVINVSIKQEIYTLLIWRRLNEQKPQEGDRCLVADGKNVLEAEFKNGRLLGGYDLPWPEDTIWTKYPELSLC